MFLYCLRSVTNSLRVMHWVNLNTNHLTKQVWLGLCVDMNFLIKCLCAMESSKYTDIIIWYRLITTLTIISTDCLFKPNVERSSHFLFKNCAILSVLFENCAILSVLYSWWTTVLNVLFLNKKWELRLTLGLNKQSVENKI